MSTPKARTKDVAADVLFAGMPFDEKAENLASQIDALVAEQRLDEIGPEALQRLMGALSRAYSAHVLAGAEFGPVTPSALTSTDAMTMASGFLTASNLAVFELAMWQAWSGH